MGCTRKSPLDFCRIAGQVQADGENATLVRSSLDYQLKMGPVSALMDKMMVVPQLGKAWQGFSAGLKHHIETGQPVQGPDGLDFGPVKAVA